MIWKKTVRGKHLMTYAPKNGTEENSGLAKIYKWIWDKRGIPGYTHPSLDPENGLVDQGWGACLKTHEDAGDIDAEAIARLVLK